MEKEALKMLGSTTDNPVCNYDKIRVGNGVEYYYSAKNPCPRDIECFYRLKLPIRTLITLKRLANTHRRLRLHDDIRIWAQEQRLWEQFYKEFDNPYDLDVEIDDERKNPTFVFYDYDFTYELVFYKSGIGISCRRSFYGDESEEPVRMDSP